FGTAKPGGSVTSQEWQEFMNQVVTPHFPEGLTSWEASGQWQSVTGVIEREASHVLHIVHPDTGRASLQFGRSCADTKRSFSSKRSCGFVQVPVCRFRLARRPQSWGCGCARGADNRDPRCLAYHAVGQQPVQGGGELLLGGKTAVPSDRFFSRGGGRPG
ncbi:MAG: DUF3574 domain-containing protein, partial [Gammaproteobacteria bacterium]